MFPWNPQPVDGATRHGAALQQHSWWLRKLSTAFALPAQPGAGEVMEQYHLRAQQAGWDVQTPPSDREAVMSNATTTVKVVVNWNDQGMYMMTVGPRHQ